MWHGRHDSDGSTPTLDNAGGHFYPTAHSNGVAVYHYHANLQTNSTGLMQWFLATGTYYGTPL